MPFTVRHDPTVIPLYPVTADPYQERAEVLVQQWSAQHRKRLPHHERRHLVALITAGLRYSAWEVQSPAQEG